jgi:hypothetical protein
VSSRLHDPEVGGATENRWRCGLQNVKPNRLVYVISKHMALNCYENLRRFLYISKLVSQPTIESQPLPPLFKPCTEVLQLQETIKVSLEEEESIEDRNI